MSRAAAAAAAVALVLVGAAACSPEGASTEEANRWLRERQDAVPAHALGLAGGPLSREDPEPSPEDGITLTFAEPTDVSEVRLECLGEGTVSFSVHVTMASQVLGQTHPDLPCGAGGHPSLSGSGVLSVKVNAFDADRGGAWNAVVLGTEG